MSGGLLILLWLLAASIAIGMTKINWRTIWFDPSWRHELTNAVITALVLGVCGVAGTAIFVIMKTKHLPLASYLIGGAVVGALIGLGLWIIATGEKPEAAKENTPTKQQTPKTELSNAATATAKRFDSPSEAQKRQEKYRWGYRIYDLDKFGGVESYINRFSKEYDFDWDAVKITPDFQKGRYRIDIPPLKLTFPQAGTPGQFLPQAVLIRGTNQGGTIVVGTNGIGGGSVEGALRIGDVGGVLVGNISVTVEILDITKKGIVALVGLNQSPLLAAIREQNKKLASAEVVATRFRELYNQDNFDAIWNEAHPELRATADNAAFIDRMSSLKTNMGKIVSVKRLQSGQTRTKRNPKHAFIFTIK